MSIHRQPLLVLADLAYLFCPATVLIELTVHNSAEVADLTLGPQVYSLHSVARTDKSSMHDIDFAHTDRKISTMHAYWQIAPHL